MVKLHSNLHRLGATLELKQGSCLTGLNSGDVFWGRIWLLGDTVIRIKISKVKNGWQFWHRHCFSPEALHFPAMLINTFFATNKAERHCTWCHPEVTLTLLWKSFGRDSSHLACNRHQVNGGDVRPLCCEGRTLQRETPFRVVHPVCLRHPHRKGWIPLWRDHSLSTEYKGSLDN